MLPSEKGIARLPIQFQDSPNLKALITAIVKGFDDLEDTGDDLLTLRGLNTAQGVQLDGVGEIVGFPRPNTVNDDGRFGFFEDPTARGFGNPDNISVGGNFIDPVSILFPVDDDTYRLLIKAKIIKNSTAMTVDDTLRLINFVFDAEVRYFLPVNLDPRYHIGKILSAFEIDLLDEFPVLIGIDSVNFETMYNDTPFGFFEDPDAFGFGNPIDSDIGGNFASSI